MGVRGSHDRFFEPAHRDTERVIAQLRPHARPLATERDLDPLLAAIGDARYVLLGEATHGTSEFYTWRARITRRLVVERGFRFVAVEGDWPDCARVDRYVKGRRGAGASARDVLRGFDRWPTWMWANDEVAALAEWMRAHNAPLPEALRVGFYGLDVYSLWSSMRAVVAYLDGVDPDAARHARRAYACFAPFHEDEHRYARATTALPVTCERAVIEALIALRALAPAPDADAREAHFDAEQNALVARNAERYYRTQTRDGAASWNVRDAHMVETLDRLMEMHGPGAKGVAWEHNTHVGDARYADMAADGEFNVGQRVRETHADDGVFVVGFSTHRGTVIAGDAWDAPMRAMPVPPGREGSYEDVLHRVGAGDALWLLGDVPATPELLAPRGHRAIGVVYHPRRERLGNYVPTVLLRRYDAMLFVDESRALSPLHLAVHRDGDLPETWPTGM